MNLGKGKFIFERGWSWISKINTIFNMLMLGYLVFLENTAIIWIAPILITSWIIMTIIDIKYILPTELEYAFHKNKEWVRFADKIEKQLKQIEMKMEKNPT